jgi:hypothetical protein
MKQYKKKTYAKTVKKTVHPKHRSGSKSTMPADSQMRGKPFEFVANEVVIGAYPYSYTEPNPLEKYAMKHGIEDENGLRVTGVNFNIVNWLDTVSARCSPPKCRIVYENCHFYGCAGMHMYLPRDIVFDGCTFHADAVLHVGHTCEIVRSHACHALRFYGNYHGIGGHSDIRIVDSSFDDTLFFRHGNMIYMENVCHTGYEREHDEWCSEYMFGCSNIGIFILDHNGNVELNKCKICAMDVSTSSIPAMKLNDTAFGFIEISNSTIDTLTVQGCAPNGHVGAIKAYQTTLTTVPDFSGSVFPVHMFPTECEGKWEESQDKLTLYKKVWYIPGISVKLPFCSKLLALGTSRRIPVIARLRVPAGTPRHLGTSSGKVRVAEATVDGFFKLEEKTHALVKFKPKFGSFRSDHDPDFKYRNGKRVRPRKRFDMTNNTCASGIHGFLTPEEADSY